MSVFGPNIPAQAGNGYRYYRQHLYRLVDTACFKTVGKSLYTTCRQQILVFAGLPPPPLPHIAMDKPDFTCTKCSARFVSHPLNLHASLAAPPRATVWYDNELLIAMS